MAYEPVQDTDPTIGRLVSDASRDVSSLIRNEIRLGKSEVQLSVKAGAFECRAQTCQFSRWCRKHGIYVRGAPDLAVH